MRFYQILTKGRLTIAMAWKDLKMEWAKTAEVRDKGLLQWSFIHPCIDDVWRQLHIAGGFSGLAMSTIVSLESKFSILIDPYWFLVSWEKLTEKREGQIQE